MSTITVGSDFSGVGAFNQALMRLGIEYKEIFACDMDKYARQTFILNYGEPEYFPKDVYEREIPKVSLDIYMTSPPCQAFSLAGKRLGKEDQRGILFFNSYEFIKTNKPRYFIFENVKGLLSDDNGNTFNEWLNLLGGKSVNGLPVLFPYEGALNYHIYYKVLNAKDYGVPQNRERVFIIGIRDDKDNTFRFPIEEHLTKRLKDVLEDKVDEKYFLSEKMLNFFINNNDKMLAMKKGFSFKPTDGNNISRTITTKEGSRMENNYIKIKSATTKGFEYANYGDSINFSQPNSETRRGRVGKQVAQTLDTGCQQGVIILDDYNKKLNNTGVIGTLTCNIGSKAERNGQKIIVNTNKKIDKDSKIRRLTPRECFRLMDFPETFIWNVSDTQAYKQAGNSIVVGVLAKIIKNFNL